MGIDQGAAAPPMPPPGSLGAFFWEGARDGRLLIQRCSACGTYIHVPRPVCRTCLSFELAPAEVSGRATVYSFTETHKAFHPFFVDRVPFLLATVELEEQAGLMLLSNLVGVGEPDVRIGMDVVVDFEVLSAELTIPVFRPAAAARS
jgi:uncharacterized OB-fold protein